MWFSFILKNLQESFTPVVLTVELHSKALPHFIRWEGYKDIISLSQVYAKIVHLSGMDEKLAVFLRFQ